MNIGREKGIAESTVLLSSYYSVNMKRKSEASIHFTNG